MEERLCIVCCEIMRSMQSHTGEYFAGAEGPVFWAQAQTAGAIRIIDASPPRVLRRLKKQLRVTSGTEVSAPAMYSLGGGQHSARAYLRKYCTPTAAFSHADISQALAESQQQSLHCQWTTLRPTADSLQLQLTCNGCVLRLRFENGLMHPDLMVRGSFQEIVLSFMDIPRHLSRQAGLRKVLEQLEHTHRCAGASAACKGKYDGILAEKRSYVNQEGEICAHDRSEDIVTKDGLFPRTVRSTACSLLVPPDTLLCKPCKHLQRSQLDSTLRRSLNSEEDKIT